jgi:hypothetical protein
MNTKATKGIELNGLKPKQIEQLKAIIEDFKQGNQRGETGTSKLKKKAN